jgi:ribosome biogenesis GTPase / thiamine phosphate phosphatase
MPDQVISLETLGWNPAWEASFNELRTPGLEPGRVAVEDKHYYVVLTTAGELRGQISGKLFHRAASSAELPKVGDWVTISSLPQESKAVIHQILPRRTKLSRKVPGREVEEQVLATNIDKAFAVQALDRTFNPALLQRHLVMVLESGAKPILVLNKADLCEDLAARIAKAQRIAGAATVVTVSAKTGEGLEALRAQIQPGETIVFIGSSGVGKSSLINGLCGEEVQATAEVRESDDKGRHTTSWRELILLPTGGLVIDTPGMREFQMWVADEGLREAFADLDALSLTCRFSNCGHTVEKGCAVLAAVAQGQLSEERYRSYLKLAKELAYLEHTQTRHAWMQRRRQQRVAQRALNNPKRQPRRTE